VKKALQKFDIARTLSKVLRDNAIEVEPDEATIGDDGLRRCFQNGWLHADNVSNDDGEKTAYIFSSPLPEFHLKQPVFFDLCLTLSLNDESAPDAFSDHRRPNIKMNSTVVVTRIRIERSRPFLNSVRRKGEWNFCVMEIGLSC
jgi:hypothetical protein